MGNLDLSALKAQLAGEDTSAKEAESSSVMATLRSIVVTATGVEPDDVTAEVKLRDGLFIDSLALVEIAVRCEDAFGGHFIDEDLSSLATIGDLEQLIISRGQ